MVSIHCNINIHEAHPKVQLYQLGTAFAGLGAHCLNIDSVTFFLPETDALQNIADQINQYLGRDIKKVVCLRCSHTWLPRIAGGGRVCPGCHSKYWATKKRERKEVPNANSN